MMKKISVAAALVLVALSTPAAATPDEDAKAVAALDTKYQAAVKASDAATMDGILADDFVLVTGSGATYAKSDLLKAARERTPVYLHQEEVPGTQTVRVFGDTAVVTAKLWLVYKSGDSMADRKLWFSDTYVRTKEGWRYVFGQSSLALPADK